MLRRRKWWFIVPAALVLTVALTVAQLWPATYRSTATILIEDGCAAFSPGTHRTAVDALRPVGRVATIAEMLAEIGSPQP